MSLTTDDKVDGFVPIATFGKRIAGVVDNPMLKGGEIKLETTDKVPFRQAVYMLLLQVEVVNLIIQNNL